MGKFFNDDKSINVAMITDSNYIIPTIVSIFSMKRNRNLNRNYYIYVFCVELTEQDILSLKNLSDKNFNIICINENPDNYIVANEVKTYVTKSALLKFVIPDLLPDIDKLIYLDSDVIVRKDISSLFDIDLSSYIAGVVNDANGIILNSLGKNKHNNKYFNSGVLLINSRLYREHNISKELITYRLNKTNKYMDQDAFNSVLSSYRIKYLSPIYNVIIGFFNLYSFNEYKKIYQLNEYSSFNNFFDDSIVIHFAGTKPWCYFDSILSEVWKQYFDLSPIASRALERKSYYKSGIFKIIPFRFSNRIQKFLYRTYYRIKSIEGK